MKHFWQRHIFLGCMIRRMDDEFIENARMSLDVKPESMRWFCGRHDLDGTFICQAL